MSKLTNHKILFLALLLIISPFCPQDSFGQGLKTPTASLEEETAQTIFNDPILLKKVIDLQKDPSFQAILNDPKLLEAVQSGNLGVLATHPAIQRLTSHPIVQEIKNKKQSTP